MSTQWDKIYKNYQKDGKAYATLGTSMLPEYINFIEKTNFPVKSVFDIGVGNGKYLTYLEKKGFTIAGIDNSETAIEMTKKILKNSDNIKLANMFEYDIPENTYGLITSTNTVHHGFKDQVEGVIKKIYSGLISGGYVFVTLPMWESQFKWESFNPQKELSPGVLAPTSGPEKGLPHSMYKLEEVEKLFKDFKKLSITPTPQQRWIITAIK